MFRHKQFTRSLTGVSIALAVLWGGVLQGEAQFTFGEPENLGSVVNSSDGDGGPSISADGLTLFFTSGRPGGEGANDLWMTRAANHGGPWEPPVNLGATVNSSGGDWDPDVSADSLTVFFNSNRPGGFGGGSDIWMTKRASVSDPWEPPENLGPTVNSSSAEGAPSIAANGLTLFMNSTRPGGFGSYDLWMTTRDSTSEPWEIPVNLGPTVNSWSKELNPSISADELTLFFGSTRAGGFGSYDLWMTTRASTAHPWEPPVNLGPGVNTPFVERGPNLSADGMTLFFISDRPGGYGDLDLWQVAVTPTCPGDIDGDCDTDHSDLGALLAAWCTQAGDPNWNPDADLDGDGHVGHGDLGILLGDWGCGT